MLSSINQLVAGLGGSVLTSGDTRDVIYSYLTGFELLTKIAKINKLERARLLQSKGIINQWKDVTLRMPSTQTYEYWTAPEQKFNQNHFYYMFDLCDGVTFDLQGQYDPWIFALLQTAMHFKTKESSLILWLCTGERKTTMRNPFTSDT